MKTIEVTEKYWKAKQAAKFYKEELAHGRGTKEDLALLKSYRAIVQGKRVIELVATMRAAGLYGLGPDVASGNRGRPRFAIARADARMVEFRCWESGACYTAEVTGIELERTCRINLPSGTFPLLEQLPTHEDRRRRNGRALVPTIPLALRPAAAQLHKYRILWEADWQDVPRDPLLLKPLGGTLYAVVAQWDLTPLERAAMMGRLV